MNNIVILYGLFNNEILIFFDHVVNRNKLFLEIFEVFDIF